MQSQTQIKQTKDEYDFLLKTILDLNIFYLPMPKIK